MKSWRVWLWFVVYGGAYFALSELLRVMLPRLPGSPALWGTLLAGLSGALAGFVFPVVIRQPIRHRLRERLVEQGVPICIPCGYDLRGQSKPRCPECGAPFDPALLGAPDRSDRD